MSHDQQAHSSCRSLSYPLRLEIGIRLVKLEVPRKLFHALHGRRTSHADVPSYQEFCLRRSDVRRW